MKYYVQFVKESNPKTPIIEQLKSKYPFIYAFPVSGEIDGIIISREYIPNSLEFISEREIEDIFKRKKNLAFLYFESTINPEYLKIVEDRDTRILYRKKNRNYEYLVVQGFTFMEKVDKLWRELYRNVPISNAKTYIAFTKRYAIVKKV